MTMLKRSGLTSTCILLQVLSFIAVVTAWTVPLQQTAVVVPSQRMSTLCSSRRANKPSFSSALRMSDQWDDEELPPAVPTYDDASTRLVKRKEEADLEGISDRTLPGSEKENQEKLRAAVQARTETLGMGKASADSMKELEQRAAARAAGGGLDLSQISDGLEKLSINFNPEDELTEEEQREADPLGFQPYPEQFMYELKETTFPGPAATIAKVVLLIVLGAVTGVLIVQSDLFIRDFYVNQGLLPSKEDIARAQNSGMEMAKELSKTTVSPGPTSGGGLPDISP